MTQETKKQKSVLDTATAHFRTKISGDMTHITVPEWGDAKIYFKSSNTLTEESRLLNLAQQGKTVEALVESIIRKAKDKDGKSLFHDADRIKLMNEADPQVVIKVATAINNAKITATQESIAKE